MSAADIGPKRVPPQLHRFVSDVDPALEQQVFHVAQRQWEADIHHHCKLDDLRGGVEVAQRAGRFARSRHLPKLALGASYSDQCVCMDSALQHDIGSNLSTPPRCILDLNDLLIFIQFKTHVCQILQVRHDMLRQSLVVADEYGNLPIVHRCRGIG